MPFLWGLHLVCFFLHGTAAFFSSAKSSDGGPAVKEYYGLKNEKRKKRKKKKWVVLKSVVFCATSASTQRASKNASGHPRTRKQSITRCVPRFTKRATATK
uniref:Putative secreted protein n=1 Tax=Ixodes scapularis TaxID=6945 RepID=A0A4D5S787_IXOSC